MIVLGLSGLPHAQPYHLRTHPDAAENDKRICQGMDSAACLVVDGDVVAAAAEERFTGAKGTGALPVHAIDYCLSTAGISRDDVDVIAHGFNYDRFRRFFHQTPEYFAEVLTGRTITDGLTGHGWSNVESRFQPIDHHLAHAASACFASGYDSALSIVADGMGEVTSISVHRYADGRLTELHRQGISASLGILYSIFTRYLGYTFNSDEYKVMGLSAYGDAERFRTFFADFLRVTDGAVVIDWPEGALRSPAEGYPNAMEFLESAFDTARRDPGESSLGVYADIAASLQRRFEEVLSELTEHWLAETGEDSVCLSGGTFLNCLANAAIARSPRIRRMFIPSATGDDGTAMGAALYAYGKPTGGFTPYTGPEYGADEVRRVLNRPTPPDRRSPWQYHGTTDEYVDLAATDLAEDRIIAWFAGRMEYGPRALGNRSILALPSGADIKDRLNHVVKLRESFRPFAPAILDTDYELAFVGRPLHPARYMLTTAEVRPEFRDRLAGAVHVDGTARVQVVSREDNELFWRLLRAVQRHTGLGCVINTSFNVKDQPIIMTPDLALDALETMSLDRLYIAGYRVSKPSR